MTFWPSAVEKMAVLERNEVHRHVFRHGLDACRFAEIPPIVAVGSECRNRLSPARQPEIGTDDRKHPVFGQHRQQSRRDYVYPAKSVRVGLLRRSHSFIARSAGRPASTKLVLFVKKQIP